MALRHQLEKAFEVVDPDKTGLISKAALGNLLTQLNPELTSSSLEPLFAKVESPGGLIRFTAFLDLFCPPVVAVRPTELKRELSKPMSDEVAATVKTVFDQFDKDKSGFIDLKELQAICTELGKKISEPQAVAAMEQLDKNGDGKVTLDEFSLWWTCTPGLGGYSNVVLGFLKGKMALKTKMNETFKRVVRKKLEDTDEFSLKANVDVTPDKAGTKVQASATISLQKKHEREDGQPAIKAKITCKDEHSAASIVSVVMDFITVAQIPPMVQVKQEGKSILFEALLPEDMVDEEAAQAISFLQDAAKKIEVKVGLGTTFEEIVANPTRPLCQFLKGGVLGADILVGLTSLIRCSRDEMPEPVISAVKCLAGAMFDSKLIYNHSFVLTIFETITKAMDLDNDDRPDYDRPDKFFCKGIAYVRERLYGVLEEDGNVRDGKFAREPTTKIGPVMVKMANELGKGCVGIESVSVVRIPGSTVEIVAKLDKVNPFPMGAYLFGHLPSPPPGYIIKRNFDDAFSRRDRRGMQEMLKLFARPKPKTDSGDVGVANPDDTCIKWQQEITPGMVECQSKMAISVMLEKNPMPSSGDKFSPSLTVQLEAKSADDAKKVAESLESLLSLEALQYMREFVLGLPSLVVTSSGTAVKVTWTPPAEIVQMIYEGPGDDVVNVISRIVDAVIGSGVSLYLATDFNDLLAAPDVGVYSVFNGSRVEGMLKCSADGKAFALDTVKHVYEQYEISRYDGEDDLWKQRRKQSMDLITGVANLFQSLDLNFFTGFHKDNVEKAMMQMEEMAKMTSPATARDLIANMFASTMGNSQKHKVSPVEGVPVGCKADGIRAVGYSDYSDDLALPATLPPDLGRDMSSLSYLSYPSFMSRQSSRQMPQDEFPSMDSEEIKRVSNVVKDMLDKLKSVTSASIDGICMPCESNDTALSLKATFTNYNIFEFLRYMSEPVFEAMKNS